MEKFSQTKKMMNLIKILDMFITKSKIIQISIKINMMISKIKKVNRAMGMEIKQINIVTSSIRIKIITDKNKVIMVVIIDNKIIIRNKINKRIMTMYTIINKNSKTNSKSMVLITLKIIIKKIVNINNNNMMISNKTMKMIQLRQQAMIITQELKNIKMKNNTNAKNVEGHLDKQYTKSI